MLGYGTIKRLCLIIEPIPIAVEEDRLMPEGRKLNIAVEDRFIVVRLNETDALLPEGLLLDNVADTLGFFTNVYTILCDLDGVECAQTDIVETVDVLTKYGAMLIARSRDELFLKNAFPRTSVLTVRPGALPLTYAEVDLLAFENPRYVSTSDLMQSSNAAATPYS